MIIVGNDSSNHLKVGCCLIIFLTVVFTVYGSSRHAVSQRTRRAVICDALLRWKSQSEVRVGRIGRVCEGRTRVSSDKDLRRYGLGAGTFFDPKQTFPFTTITDGCFSTQGRAKFCHYITMLYDLPNRVPFQDFCRIVKKLKWTRGPGVGTQLTRSAVTKNIPPLQLTTEVVRETGEQSSRRCYPVQTTFSCIAVEIEFQAYGEMWLVTF